MLYHGGLPPNRTVQYPTIGINGIADEEISGVGPTVGALW
jgi:hypothetical protein